MDQVMGREFRVKSARLLGMWYNALGFFAAPVFLYFMFDDVPLRAPYVLEVAAVILIGVILLGIHELAKALLWTFARVSVDDMGIAMTSLSGQNRIDFMNLEGMDFLDKDGILRLDGRGGEKLDLSTGLEGFTDMLNLVLERAVSNQLISHMGDHYPNRRLYPMTLAMGLAGGLVGAAVSVLVLDSWFIAIIIGIGLLIGVLFTMLAGLKWVELDGQTITVRYVWHGKTVEVADVQSVGMTVVEINNKNKRKLVIRLSVAAAKDVDIPMRGPALLPLFVRLKQTVR